MMTRRYAILAGVGFPASLALASGEFWNDKKPSEWSEKEAKKLLTKSPWAKEVTAGLTMRMGMGGMESYPGGLGG